MEIKLITYNIDGLPETLDLNDLPWIFKPLVWIYKLIKGTTIITINDNVNKKESIEKIADYLASSDTDIINVQEGFNYHDELISKMGNIYNCGTYLGGFNLSKIFSNTEWLTYFPLPRFKCDGLNIFAKKDKVSFSDETIVPWKKSCGYFRHANDALTHKGFRFYQVKVDNETLIDVYEIHMDANFYSDNTKEAPKDLKARKAQLKQLVEFIINKDSKNPMIIFGDTNCYDKYSWDKNNIEENLINPINNTDYLSIIEIHPSNHEDCDKIFLINNRQSKKEIKVKKCYFDKNMGGLSDHTPLIGIFEIL